MYLFLFPFEYFVSLWKDISEKSVLFKEFEIVLNFISFTCIYTFLQLLPMLHSFMINVPAGSVKNTNETLDGSGGDKTPEKQPESSAEEKQQESSSFSAILSEKRKALFEPLEPVTNSNGKRPSAESLLPPPDFESASYPKGWLIGKKRKLVNVDVVESMRRIAVQEMNRKVLFLNKGHRPLVPSLPRSNIKHMFVESLQDREIDGLNEQLEEDARCLEHLQLQLLDERSKRADVERQNNMLQNQITMLMDVLQENEAVDDEGTQGD